MAGSGMPDPPAERIGSLLAEAYALHSTSPHAMLPLIEEALSLSEEHGLEECRLKCFNLFSIYYGVTGDYHTALEYSLEALRAMPDSVLPETLSARYSNISILYGRLLEHEMAVRYSEMAVEQAGKSGERKRLALALNNLGAACEKAGDGDRALECYLQAAEILEETGPVDQYTLTMVNIGQQYSLHGDDLLAEDCLAKALEAARKNGNEFALAAASLELAELYSKVGRDSFEIRRLLERAVSVADGLDDKDLLGRAYETMSRCYEKTGDFAGALEAHRRYADIREEVMGYEKMLAVSSVKKELEYIQKEKQAEIYRLKNVELVRARDAAEAADKAKSDFLAMMSHDIRTPLNVILGMLELALAREPDIEVENCLRKCGIASRSLLELINDILDYSRIEAGRIEFECVPFSPEQLARETVSIFENTAAEKMLSLDLRLGEGLPRCVSGDPGRVGQVLRNLLSNALKFTDSGSVSVSVVPMKEPGGLEFSVSDTGPGIAPGKLESLFEPFVQASSSIARTHGGSGLGLAICRRLMEGMGGSITAVSRPGEGSVFTASAVFGPVTGSECAADTAADSVRGLTGANVMVVEDMDAGREVARLFLESLGADVIEAENGLCALELLESSVPDMILMDLQMPGIDGLETASRIREMGIDVPIIASTAHAMQSHRDMCLSSGMNDVLTKPFSIAELKRVLSRWVNKKPVA
jgi:signal transduction histidine kinase